MSFPQYPAFLQQVRENDPTRVTGFVANILETPIVKEERLRAHRVSALKLYHAACLKDKAQREAQEAADAVRAASKAKREVERNRRHQEAKAKAARAGAFHPHSAKTEASSPAIQQLDSERLVERVRTLEGEIDHLSGRNAELESRIEAMKLETDSLKQLNSDLSEKRGNVLDEEAVKGILSRLCLDAQYEPTPEEALQCVAAHGFYQFTGYLGRGWFAAPAFVRLRTRTAVLSILGRKRKKPAEASLFLFAQMPAPITSRPRFRP